MKKPKGGFRAFVFCILFVVVIPIAIYSGAKDSMEYTRRGIKVQCTVTSVTRIGKKQHAEVTYRDKDNNLITANIIANKPVSLHEEIEGYVLPEKPGEVYRPAGIILKLFLAVIFIFLFVVGIALPVMYITSCRNYKLLFYKGIPGHGEVVEKPAEYGDSYCAKMRFVTNDGQEIIKEFTFDKRVPNIGNEYSIVYYFKKNGKCIADVIEL